MGLGDQDVVHSSLLHLPWYDPPRLTGCRTSSISLSIVSANDIIQCRRESISVQNFKRRIIVQEILVVCWFRQTTKESDSWYLCRCDCKTCARLYTIQYVNGKFQKLWGFYHRRSSYSIDFQSLCGWSPEKWLWTLMFQVWVHVLMKVVRGSWRGHTT